VSRYSVHMAQMWRVKSLISQPVGGEALSQLYFSKLPGLEPGNAVARVGAFWNSYRAYMSTDYSVTVSGDVEVVDVDSGHLIEVTTIDSAGPYVGTDEGDRLPPQTQGLGRFPTGVYVAGRQLRGRMFLPGVTESNSTDGAPGGGYVSAVTEDLQNLAAVTITVIPLVYSHTHHVGAPMSGASLWSKWASLRSRRD